MTADATSRALMRLSNRGPPRTEFLREASKLLLGSTAADALVAWLEDGSWTFLWRADDARTPPLEFELLGRGPSEQTLEARALECMDETGELAAKAVRVGHSGLLVPAVAAEASASTPTRRLVMGQRTGSVLLLPFEIDAANRGLIQLERDESDGFSSTEIEELERMAQLLGVAVANRRAQAARAERVKELACMYRISQIGAEEELPLQNILQRVVELLPPAWQYPQIARARIVVGDHEYLSHEFSEGTHRLRADIRVRGTNRGHVEVFYIEPVSPDEQAPLLEETAFLLEEHHLIEGVARALASILERKEVESEKARLQEQVRHADRLATIGQLAAGVAHELNEPLANVLGFAQLALKSPGLPAQSVEDLEAIVTASLYAREIIKKLMFFARQAPVQMAPVDLNRVVEDGMSFLATRCADAGLVVERALAEDLSLVHGDRAQLQQVLVNLVVNAMQAMHGGGTLRVSTMVREKEVVLSVADTGPGVAEEHLDKIFVPFFTTKDVGEGTGLGLSVVHGIVSAHGGRVEVESRLGEGTRFDVLLPVAVAAPSAGARP